jgi:hypothetical protein
MTIKDLERIVLSPQQQQQDSPEMRRLIERCRGKPFWLWHDRNHKQPIDTNEDCCFAHIVGLPMKGGRKHIMYDYEYELFKYLEIPYYANKRPPTKEEEEYFKRRWIEIESKTQVKGESVRNAEAEYHKEKVNTLIYKHKVGRVACAKAASLGITHFCLLYILWLCLRNDKLKGSDVAILTGVRELLSLDIINRIRKILSPHGIRFDTAVNTLFINGVRIRSYPSTVNSLHALRGQENISIIYASEAAFFDKNAIPETIDVIERYAGKSNAKIILESTVNRKGDLLDIIMNQQKFEESFYKILRLSYEWGIGKIYSEQDIEVAKASVSFNREYALSWISPSGNCFSPVSIDRAVELGKKYPDIINKEAEHSLGIDPGFSSSQMAYVCLEYSDSIIKVVSADMFDKMSFADSIQKVWDIKNMVGTLSNIYCDAVNVEYVGAIKDELGENSNWQYIRDNIAYCRKNKLKLENYMRVIPVSFGQEGPSMLVHLKQLLDHPDELIVINPKYTDLITALKGAVATEYKLDKSESPFNDLTDGIRLAAKFFTLGK